MSVFNWAVRRREYDREMKDLRDDLARTQGYVNCLQGYHDWGTSRDSAGLLYIRCSRCYVPHVAPTKDPR